MAFPYLPRLTICRSLQLPSNDSYRTNIMKVLVLALLSLLTVNYAASLTLRPKVLQPDLEAILKYYNKIDDSLLAYIHWPEEITYRVRLFSKSEGYLKIDGTFSSSKLGCASASHDGLYFKNNIFYFKDAHHGLFTEISPERSLHYSNQPEIENALGESYLSIRYFGLKEIKATARLTYETEKSYYENALPTNPAKFLLTPRNGKHFLEYTFLSSKRRRSTPEVEGGLRILGGNKLMARWKVKKSVVGSKLLVDPKTFSVAIPDDINGGSFDHDSIFGVRMESVGFLAEHRGYEMRMLNSDDISGNGNRDQHFVSADDFLMKVRTIEPALCSSAHGFKSMPKSGRFQLRGHFFLKFMNYNENQDQLDPECPFTIEPHYRGLYFLIGTNDDPVDEVCTDEVRFWPKGDPYPTDGNNGITLVRPSASD